MFETPVFPGFSEINVNMEILKALLPAVQLHLTIVCALNEDMPSMYIAIVTLVGGPKMTTGVECATHCHLTLHYCYVSGFHKSLQSVADISPIIGWYDDS